MNRAQRRKQDRAERRAIAEMPDWKRADFERRLETTARMMRQGISEQDLNDAYDRGRREVIKRYADEILPYQQAFFYSAAAIAAHELFGFGKERGERLLDRIQEIMLEEIQAGDIIERCRRETGVDVTVGEYTI